MSGACSDAGLRLERDGNPERAAGLYERGCDGGDAPGCLDLALLVRDGRGVARDAERARALAVRACAGDVAAGCLVAGELLLADPAAAAAKLRRACELGESRGCTLVSSGDVAGARARVLCDEGDLRGCFNLAVAKEGAHAEEAAALYTRACPTVALACTNLGRLFERGAGTVRDPARARARYQQARDAGEPIGCTNLGVMALAARDVPRAANAFCKACDLGDADACRRHRSLAERTRRR